MTVYQLRLSNERLAEVIDRIAADANAVAPGLGRERARNLLDLLFRTRVVQSAACGKFPQCEDASALWGGKAAPPAGEDRPCRFGDEDPFDLPNMFAVAATDLMDLGIAASERSEDAHTSPGFAGRGCALSNDERDSIEERLAAVFRAALQGLVHKNAACGTLDICESDRTDPFAPTDESPAKKRRAAR